MFRALLIIIAGLLVVALGGYATYDLYSYSSGKADEAAGHSDSVERKTYSEIQSECQISDPLLREICFRDHYEAQRASERAEGDLQAQQNMARATLWIATLAWIQTVIALGGLYFVIGSVDAAAASAKAAGLQIETQILADRPRLRVVEIKPEIRTHPRSEAADEAIISCDVVNFGKTPAFVSEYCFRYRVFNELPGVPDYDFTRSDNNFIVFPDRAANRGPYTLQKHGKNLASLPRGKTDENWMYTDKVVLFYGYFVFEDAYGNVRKIGFGYSISPISEVTLVGGDAYNYEKVVSQPQ